MLNLKLCLTGLGITKRDDLNAYVSRSVESFGSLLDNICGKPIVLEHPQDLDTGVKSLLNTNSDFSIIGSIDSVDSITDDAIFVNAHISDPYFISYYNSLSDEEKALLNTSPAVTSKMIEESVYDDNVLYKEQIQDIDHLALLIVSEGYWNKYLDDNMVQDTNMNQNNERYIIENNNIDNGDMQMPIMNTNSTAHVSDEELTPIVGVADSEQSDAEQNIEVNIDNEDIENKEEVSAVDSSDENMLEVITGDSPESVSKHFDDNEEQSMEEIKTEEKVIDESVEEVVEELVSHEADEAKAFEELAQEHEHVVDEEDMPKSDEVVDDEDEIKEEYITDDDTEREIVAEIVHNLVDSVDGFKKPYFKNRVKAETYVRKALSLNKDFVDSKYHTSIDSISLELGKELLGGIKSSKSAPSIKKEYTQVSANKFVKSFI